MVNLPDVLCVAGIMVVALGASVVALFVQEEIQITQRLRQRIEKLRGFEDSELPQWDVTESVPGVYVRTSRNVSVRAKVTG